LNLHIPAEKSSGQVNKLGSNTAKFSRAVFFDPVRRAGWIEIQALAEEVVPLLKTQQTAREQPVA